jgi:hypothetical protein
MRNEAAGLLELRGANALFTPFLSFFFFSLPIRGACTVERRGAHIHGFGALTITPLGSAFRSCEGLTGAGAAVAATRGITRVVHRGPSELLETTISQNTCSLEERWIDNSCRHGFNCFLLSPAYFRIYTNTS